jgi:hypothetical protein
MNKKTIIIVNILILLFVGGFVFWYLSQSNTTEQNNNNKPAPTNPTNENNNTQPPITSYPKTEPEPTENANETKKGMLKISTKDGDTVFVKDFYQSPYTKIFDEQKDAVIKDGINYTITYYTQDQSFFISLTGGDFHIARSAAEDGFLKKLDISKEDACRLYVSLTVPFFASQKASGEDYHLSFCPDNIPLPKNL